MIYGNFAQYVREITRIDPTRVEEGIIGWLIGKLPLHGYFPYNLIVNVARQ